MKIDLFLFMVALACVAFMGGVMAGHELTMVEIEGMSARELLALLVTK